MPTCRRWWCAHRARRRVFLTPSLCIDHGATAPGCRSAPPAAALAARGAQAEYGEDEALKACEEMEAARALIAEVEPMFE